MSISLTAPSASNPEEWKAWIREQARTVIPQLYGLPPLEPLLVAPALALPTKEHTQPSLSNVRLPETGGIPKLRETAVISAVKQLRDVIRVRDTKELLHTAIAWFLEKHGFLPYAIGLNTVRYLAIPKAHIERFPIEGYEDQGWFTVEVECNNTLTMDTIELKGGRWFWEVVTDFYL